MLIPRRTILGLAIGAGSLFRLKAGPIACQRRYRAHATVTLLSVPLVSKSDVGSGFISIEQGADDAGCKTTIQFGAGSWPESAHGLNRLGFIEETVIERRPGEPAECSYFAFMTSSQEKSLDQAKKALQASGDSVPYAAAEGAGHDGRFVSRLNRFSFSSRFTWRDCPQLIDKVRAAVSTEPPSQSVEKALDADEAAPATFLYAVRRAILDPAPTSSGSLIYNGKEFGLRTVKEHAREGRGVVRLAATLQERATGQQTPFKVWYAAGEEHMPPLRFEYQAKSFLRLTFTRQETT